MITKVLVNHSDTYYYNVRHTALAAKWRIRLGMALRLHCDPVRMVRVPRRHVVALAEREDV